MINNSMIYIYIYDIPNDRKSTKWLGTPVDPGLVPDHGLYPAAWTVQKNHRARGPIETTMAFKGYQVDSTKKNGNSIYIYMIYSQFNDGIEVTWSNLTSNLLYLIVNLIPSLIHLEQHPETVLWTSLTWDFYNM